MTEISEEEEQALLEVQLDNMALEEQPTVAASTMRQLQALQNQMNQLLEQQHQQPQPQQQRKRKRGLGEIRTRGGEEEGEEA